MPNDLKDLISNLLAKDPAQRLAGEAIKKHRFFDSFSFEAFNSMARGENSQIKIPSKPELKFDSDTYYFDSKYKVNSDINRHFESDSDGTDDYDQDVDLLSGKHSSNQSSSVDHTVGMKMTPINKSSFQILSQDCFDYCKT